MPLLEGTRLIALDTETTGLDAGAHVLIEVACVPLADGVLGEGWSSLVCPARPVPRDAMAVHGITDAMVADAPPPAVVGPELRRCCGDRPLVLHHAAFDLPFLQALLREAGQPPLWNPVIDTLGLARGLPLEPGGHGLGALAARLGLPPEPAHRALPDARTTARLLAVLAARWERERGVRSLAELAAASQDVLRTIGHRAPPRALAPA